MKTIASNKTSGWIILTTLLYALAHPAFAQTYSITPNPATVSEGAGTLTFTITRSGATPAETIYASTTTTEGYANSSDYTGIANQSVSFTSGATTRTVTVTILNDSTTESSETFGFIVQRNTSDPVSTYLAKRTFTITDDDVTTTYAITPNPASVNENGGSLTFTITRSGATPAETIYASTTTTEGYANSSDYTGIANQSVSFTSGATTRTVTVTILNDSTTESSETFGFIVQRNTSDPVSTYLAKRTFTITDDDVTTTYAITPNPATVSEGAGTLTFTITRSGATPAETIYASTTTTEGSANNSDYTGVANQSVSFTSGATTRTVAVTINNDTTVESSETFGFIVQRNNSDPVTTYLAKSTFTITDNDEPPPTTYAITPNPATVDESVGTLTFTITRSGGTPAETIYASTTTTEGSANNSDYTGIANQSVSFTSGATTRTVAVTINNDTTVESSEAFGFIVQRNTSDPVTTYLAKSTFTITDDDGQPPTGRPDPSSAPGIRFSLPLASDSPSHYYFDRNPASGAVLAWNGVTTDGISGGAYDGHRGTDFSGIVRNTPVYAAAGGTLIEKDDGHPDGSLNETTFPNGNFVRINHGNDNTGTPIISVYLHLNAGTVTTKLVGSLIGAGELIGGVGMSGQADGLHVHFETQRGTPPNRIAFDPYAASGETTWWSSGPTATTYAITPNPATVDEGGGTLTFTIIRSGGTPAETIYASTTTTEGTANNSDYTGIANQAVSFTSGATTRTVAVTINNDTTGENNETFGFIVQRNTSDPVTTYLAKSIFTITDTDAQPTTYAITPNPATVDEGAGTLTFTITRSGATPVETIYASTTTTEGSANSGDYSGIVNQSVNFTSGATTRTVTVTINNDTTVENNETFGFIAQRNTSDPVSTYLAKSTFTITDNDVLGMILSVTPANPPTQPATAGSLNINVNNTGVGVMNYSATITSGNAWLHINSGASGGNSGTIAISYDANSGGQRVGTIVVTATGAAGSPTIITIAQAASGQQHLAGIKIGVDPGHGGSDTGASGPNLGLTEKSVNLATALALKKYLESEGATVVMTRTTDSTVSLPTRSSLFINSAVDLAISVHHNAGGLNTTMVFIYCDASLATRGALASHVVQRLGNSTGITISQSPSSTVDTLCGGHSDWLTGLVGVGQANLHMVREPETGGNIPSILAEVSFITDPTEEAKLQSTDYLDKNGWAIYAGVADYYGFPPAPRTSPVFTGIGGGGIQPPSSGQFQFQIIAPTMQEVTVQACDDINNWSDHSTLPLINGQCIFVDPNTSGHTQRYYRLKQP